MQQQLGGKSKKKCERNSPGGTKVSIEEGQEVFQGQSSSSLKPRRGPTVEQAASLQPMGTHGADLCVQLVEEPTYSSGCGLKEVTIHGEPPQKQATGQRSSSWWATHSGAAAIGTCIGAVFKGWHPMEAPHTTELGQRETVKEQLR